MSIEEEATRVVRFGSKAAGRPCGLADKIMLRLFRTLECKLGFRVTPSEPRSVVEATALHARTHRKESDPETSLFCIGALDALDRGWKQFCAFNVGHVTTIRPS